MSRLSARSTDHDGTQHLSARMRALQPASDGPDDNARTNHPLSWFAFFSLPFRGSETLTVGGHAVDVDRALVRGRDPRDSSNPVERAREVLFHGIPP